MPAAGATGWIWSTDNWVMAVAVAMVLPVNAAPRRKVAVRAAIRHKRAGYSAAVAGRLPGAVVREAAVARVAACW